MRRGGQMRKIRVIKEKRVEEKAGCGVCVCNL
jgi:hypothetical protein